MLSADQRYVKFLWGKLTIKGAKDKDVEAVELYAIKGNRDNEPAMSGGVVTDAKDTFSVRKTSCFDANERQGAKGWEELTGRAYTQKSNIAIVLDNIVFGVSSGPKGGVDLKSLGFDVTETRFS
jgi:SecD/SecF fusion protein